MSTDISNMRILVLSDRSLQGYSGGIIQFLPMEGIEDIARAVEEATDYLYNKEGVVLIQDGAGSVISGGPIPANDIRQQINFGEIPNRPTDRFIDFVLTPDEKKNAYQLVIPVQDIRKEDFGDLSRHPDGHPLLRILRAGLLCLVRTADGKITLSPDADFDEEGTRLW